MPDLLSLTLVVATIAIVFVVVRSGVFNPVRPVCLRVETRPSAEIINLEHYRRQRAVLMRLRQGQARKA